LNILNKPSILDACPYRQCITFVFKLALKETEFLKHGKSLWLQQILTLLSKRFLIFYRRYILAITIMLFPCLLQVIICILVPSIAVLDASKPAIPVSSLGQLDLSISKYGATNLPYSVVSNTGASGRFDQLLSEFYAARSSSLQLDKLEEVANSVFQEKKRQFSSIYSRNFLGSLFWNLLHSSLDKLGQTKI